MGKSVYYHSIGFVLTKCPSCIAANVAAAATTAPLYFRSMTVGVNGSTSSNMPVILFITACNAILAFREIIVDTLYNTAFAFRLCDIQVCHMESVLLLHSFLDFFICSLTLGGCQIQLVHIDLNADMMLRLIAQQVLSALHGNIHHYCLVALNQPN